MSRDFTPVIYVELFAQKFLDKYNIKYKKSHKKNYLGKWLAVLEIKVGVSEYHQLIRFIEQKSKHSLTLYQADVFPEQQFMFENNIYPGCQVDDNLKCLGDGHVDLITVRISPTFKNKKLEQIIVDEKVILGNEKEILERFLVRFNEINPDVVIMEYAFSQLPLLVGKLQSYNLDSPFHRWDKKEIKYKGGKSFFSYGSVLHRDFAIRLNGRFLIDSTSTIGSESPENILELSRLTGGRFQQIASRSYGATFQHALTKVMYQDGLLVPYKEKPVDIPLTMFDLLKADRGGHTFDAKVGMHQDVAEVDFSSMFPWLIYNKNISADTILAGKGPYNTVPDLPIKISQFQKGLIPRAIKPILDARMRYKQLGDKRANILKMVLVTAYGYLRFREFKLGIASSHMVICSYARETIMHARRLAEDHGFEVIHGIIDSLYIKKKNISELEVRKFCEELEQLVGIPVSFEGVFKWIVFLPSINDSKRPLPATYYGIFTNGKIKARGIEVRQTRSPKVVKIFQQQILERMATCNTKKDILLEVPEYCRQLRAFLTQLNNFPEHYLAHKVRISKLDYKHDLPQKKIVAKLTRQGVKILPGMSIKYVIQKGGRVVGLDDYNGNPDLSYYRKLLTRSLFIILQPFISRLKLEEELGVEKQLKIPDFCSDKLLNYIYVPYFYNYKDNKGLSERQFRRQLEKQGWLVWRGGSLNIFDSGRDLYPNVQRKYHLLFSLLGKYHHNSIDLLKYLSYQAGMPDFICFRYGKFKFVECKFNHESLSKRQVQCILKLQAAGFKVEVMKFVDPKIRLRQRVVNTVLEKDVFIEKQVRIN